MITKGMKSSEFYVALVGAFIPIANEFFGLGIPLESVVTLLGYILGRSYVKGKEVESVPPK